MYIVFKLCIHRHELHHPNIRARYGFLYGSFKNGVEFWEVHEIFRKLVLTGILVYIESPILKVVFALSTCLISVGNLNFFQPHKTREIFWVVETSFLLTSLKYIVAAILLYRQNTASVSEMEILNRTAIGGVLITVDCLFILWTIFIAIHAVRMLKHRTKRGNKRGGIGKKKIKVIKPTAILPISKPDEEISEANQNSKVAKLKDLRTKHGAHSKEYRNAMLEMTETNPKQVIQAKEKLTQNDVNVQPSINDKIMAKEHTTQVASPPSSQYLNRTNINNDVKVEEFQKFDDNIFTSKSVETSHLNIKPEQSKKIEDKTLKEIKELLIKKRNKQISNHEKYRLQDLEFLHPEKFQLAMKLLPKKDDNFNVNAANEEDVRQKKLEETRKKKQEEIIKAKGFTVM